MPAGASWSARLLAWLPFVASAALVAIAIQLLFRSPVLGGLVLALAVIVLVPQFLSRRRLRRVLMSGDINAVLAVWTRAIDRVPHRETMEPLLLATAFAAHGLTDRARFLLERAKRGDAWEAAVEHRLFVEALLDTLEGQREDAVHKAESVERLPLPAAGPFLRDRVVLLRSALAAFARAFAHAARPGDVELMTNAGQSSPLVHWLMRYGAAVALIDRGSRLEARALLETAPRWPEESVFHLFHAEIDAELKLA
jgi:hypothetical protein